MDEAQVHRRLVAEVKKLRKEVAELKQPKYTCSWEYSSPVQRLETPLSLFGGLVTDAQVDDLPSDTASGSEYDTSWRSLCLLHHKVEQLIAYFTRRAKENTKRADKEEREVKKMRSVLRFSTAQEYEDSSYYFSGKSSAYENAARKVREILG